MRQHKKLDQRASVGPQYTTQNKKIMERCSKPRRGVVPRAGAGGSPLFSTNGRVL